MARESLLPTHRTRRHNHLSGSAHADRVIFERRAATEAHLIFLAMNAAMGPRKAMRAEPSKNVLEECVHIRLATTASKISAMEATRFRGTVELLSPKVSQKHCCHPTRQSICDSANGQWFRIAIAPIVCFRDVLLARGFYLYQHHSETCHNREPPCRSTWASCASAVGKSTL